MESTSYSKSIKLQITKVKKWIRENKKEALALLIIILIASFLRLYKISEYMTFLGDEGRDVIIVRRFLVEGDLMLVGPGTSIGNMYLGPLYYYLMAPALLLSFLSPVGPAVMVALFGVATVFFIWYVAREWFPVKAGKINYGALIAAALYATAPVVIIYSRSSWNPNIMPFFALLCIYSIWKFWVEQKFSWLIVLGVSTAFVLQSHYLGLILLPIIGLFWLITFFKVRGLRFTKDTKVMKNQDIKGFYKNTIVATAIFLFLMSPLFIFDARHGWRNVDAVKVFFTQRQTTVSARPWSSIPKIPELATTVATRLVAGTNETVGTITTKLLTLLFIFVSAMLVYIYKTQRGDRDILKSMQVFALLAIWIGTALVGFGIYKQHIYDHYFGFLFPAPFLLLAGFSKYLTNYGKTVGKLTVIGLFAYLLYVNINNLPIYHPPARQLQRSIEVGEKIIEEAGGEKFNLAVIAERNYEGAYQYHLERQYAPIVMIDPQRADETIAEQLFVVCEMLREQCDPTHNAKAEIASFGWSRVEEEWEIAGVTLFKLVHY